MTNNTAGKINRKKDATQYSSMRRLSKSSINRENIATSNYQTTTTPCVNMLWSDLLLSQYFVPLVGCQMDCCGLTQQVVKHHTVIHLHSISQWDGEENQKDKCEKTWWVVMATV